MKNPWLSNRSLVGISLAWQVVLCVLAGGGIFVDIFGLLVIPWNSTGPINIIATAIGFALLELPLIIVLIYLFRRRSKKGAL